MVAYNTNVDSLDNKDRIFLKEEGGEMNWVQYKKPLKPDDS